MQYVIKLGNLYFAGYSEVIATFVFNDQAGMVLHNAKIYKDRKSAEKEADILGGIVEELQ
ncbi:hypothetical protein [Enterococcus sp. LJL90]